MAEAAVSCRLVGDVRLIQPSGTMPDGSPGSLRSAGTGYAFHAISAHGRTCTRYNIERRLGLLVMV